MPFPSLEEFTSSQLPKTDQTTKPDDVSQTSSAMTPSVQTQTPAQTPAQEPQTPKVSLAEFGRKVKEVMKRNGTYPKELDDEFGVDNVKNAMSSEELTKQRDILDEKVGLGFLKQFPKASSIVDIKSSSAFDRIKTEYGSQMLIQSRFQNNLARALQPTEGKVQRGLSSEQRVAAQIPIDVPRLYKALKEGRAVDDFLAQHDEQVGIDTAGRQAFTESGIDPLGGWDRGKLDAILSDLATRAYRAGQKTFPQDVKSSYLMLAQAYREGGVPLATEMSNQIGEEHRAITSTLHDITDAEKSEVEAAKRKAAFQTGLYEAATGFDQTVKNVVGGLAKTSPFGMATQVAMENPNQAIIPGVGQARQALNEAAPEVEALKKTESVGQAIIHAVPGVAAGLGEMTVAAGAGSMVGAATKIGPVLGGMLGLQADTAIQNLDKPLTEQAKHQLMTAALNGSMTIAPIAQAILAKYGIAMSDAATLGATAGISAAGNVSARAALDPNATRAQLAADALIGGMLPLGFAAIHGGQQRLGQSKPRLMDQVTALEQPQQREVAGLLPEPKFNIRSEEPQVIDQQIKPAKAGGIEVIDIYGDPKVKYEVANEQEARFHLDNLKTFASSEEFKQLPKEKQAVVRDEVARLGRELLMEPEVIGMTPEELLASQRKLSGVPVTGEGGIKASGVRAGTPAAEAWRGGESDWTDIAMQQIPENNPAKKEYVAFVDEATRSTAEASLMPDASMYGVEGEVYYFNRLKSNNPGKGGGSKVLNQLIEHSEAAGVPILNEVNAYGNLSQEELVRFYKARGFKPVGEEFGDDLLIYTPTSKLRRELLIESNDRMETLGKLRSETIGPEMEAKSDFDRYFGEWLTSKTPGEAIRPRAAVKIPASTPEMPVMYVNDTAAKLFQKAWADVYPTTKLTPSNPVALSTKSLPKVIGQLFDEASRHPAGSVERTELEGLAGTLGYLWASRPDKGGSFQVLPVLSGESIKKILVARRHELVHQEQMQMAANTGQTAKDVYKLTDPGFLATHPLSDKILSEGGYLLDHYAPEAWTAEAVAYAASGEGFRIGLTPGESAQLVSDYRTHLQAKYGEVGGQIFKRVAPEISKQMWDTNNEAKGIDFFHGTDMEFTKFDPHKSTTEAGIFFTPLKDYAATYGGKTKSVSLRITNPFYLEDRTTGREITPELVRELQKKGYDSIVVGVPKAIGDLSMATEVVVFGEGQIRDNYKATSNLGSPNNTSGARLISNESIIEARKGPCGL